MKPTSFYAKLAKYYDLTHHFRDYRQQADFIISAITEYLPSARRTLDVACGTGGHAIYVAERGYSVVGIDRSDVVYCFGLSFMLLTTYDEIFGCLSSINKAIKPGGLFVFDVCNGWKMLDVRPPHNVVGHWL